MSITSERAGRRHLRRLRLAFSLVITAMVVELLAAYFSGSLALLSDAGHMATDALGLGMALAAVVAADRATAGGSRTYGLYRLEILAALANAILLLAVGAYVVFEAAARWSDPPEVDSGPMLVVAVVGLVVNVVAWRMLRAGADESVNVEGAYVEVLADLAGSVGVIIAAGLIALTGWLQADPLFAALIGVLILPRAWRLGRKALRVLVQAAPPGFDLAGLEGALSSITGVVDIHDLHVWTLTSEMEVATVHLMTTDDTSPHPVLDQARHIMRELFGISHATLQVEPESHRGCSEVNW
jgi:cobalt-zinc-cadmium efflux system protein